MNRMSEVFRHPEKFRLNNRCLVSGLHARNKLSLEQEKSVNHAVQSHDQLVEENNQLRYNLEESTRYLKLLLVVDDNLDRCMELIERNEKLLGSG